MRKPTLISEKARLRGLLDPVPYGVPITDEAILTELRHHKDWDEACNVRKRRIGPGEEFVLEVYIGNVFKDDIGWVTALRYKLGLTIPQDNPLHGIRKAFRDEVRPQIRALGADSRVSEVDHTGKDFAQLRREFLEEEGLQESDLKAKQTQGSFKWAFVDRALASRWTRYHEQNCELVVRSKEEHRKLTAERRRQQATGL
jgi:hypothetical protein